LSEFSCFWGGKLQDGLTKLMKLPIHFFDAKNIGDIMQRIGDHGRIQGFMSGTALSTIFSLCQLLYIRRHIGLLQYWHIIGFSGW
jgi:ABC-type bacteriocin/lantibiotic exporter with double-glycine peptidase domain